MNNQAAAAKVVSAEQSSTTRQGVIVKLAFDNKPETDEPLILTAKMKNTGEKTVQLDVSGLLSNASLTITPWRVVLLCSAETTFAAAA